MNITVFTSNQSRHLHLINKLASVADRVFAIQEVNTVFPGLVKDFFDNSAVMRDYFSRVIAAEQAVFGKLGFLAGNVSSLSIKSGDLSRLDADILAPALNSDYFVVFGASFIKGWLVEALIERKAINIHMGVSPYYRGSSCNFWAAYEGNIQYVGSTVHMLSKGLDSGNMLYHALPKAQEYEAFELGMRAVEAAHESLAARLATREIHSYSPQPQDRSQEVHYTRASDFTDKEAGSYLANMPTSEHIGEVLNRRDMSKFLHPYVPDGRT